MEILVKEVKSFPDVLPAMLFLYDGVKPYYSDARRWIAKVALELNKENKGSRAIYVAMYGDDIIGVMVTKPCEGKICSLYVAKRFRSVGVVQKLLEEILTEDAYWYMEVPAILEDKYDFLKKYFGFELTDVDSKHRIYEYGKFNIWYSKKQLK